MSRPSITIFAGVVAVLATGCTATSPPYAEKVDGLVKDVPKQYVAGSPAGEVDEKWIARFKDKSLTRLVDELEQNNLDLKIAAVQIERAVATAFLEGAPARPTLQAKFATNRQKQNFIGFPVGGGPGGGGEGEVSGNIFNTYGPSLDVAWEIDLWGRVKAGVSATLADLDAKVADERALRTSLAAQTAKAYFSLREAEEQVIIAEETRDSFAKTVVTFVDAALERGEQPVFQARLAKTDEATAEASLKERQQVRDDAKRQVELLLGRYPEGTLSTAKGLPELPARPPAGLPASLLRRRPDMIAAERKVAEADMRIKEAKLALLPQISLTSSIGTSSEELRDIFDKDFSVYNLAFNAVQYILTGGELRGNVILRNLALKEALLNYEKTALTAFREVETALDAEEHLAGRWQAAQKALKLAKEAYDTARKDYAEGNVDALTLLSAQRQWLNLRAQEVTLKGLRLANRIDLHLALGGDYKPRK